MDDRGVDDCSRINKSRNEMNLEEQNVMKSSQETLIKSHANKNVEMSSRVSGSLEVEVKSNSADKCNSFMNCDNDKGDNDKGIEVVIFDDALVKKGSERWGVTLCGQFVGYGMHINELKYNLRIMWSKFGVNDIDLRDSMTTKMCHKGLGNLELARVLVEMEAIKELKMEIEIQYMDKEKNIKGCKKVQVNNADKGKLDDDDYNDSKERNNVEGNCGENQHRNDGFVMQNRRRMYNKDPSKKWNPSIARSTANNVRHDNILNKGGVNRIHNNEPRQEYRKKHGETEKLEKKKENNGATKNKWNVNGNWADDSENFEDVCCDQNGTKKVMEENVINGIEEESLMRSLMEYKIGM
nr:ATPase, F1/V1/A1 complex, alpha/beta subunit, zinc knuckle CX2CX4HX4C [Tanacetum cinerariifolium]